MTEPTSSKERAAQIIREGQETPNETEGFGHHASVYRIAEDRWVVCKRDQAPTPEDPRLTTQELREVWTEDTCMVIEDPRGGDNEIGGDDPEELEMQIAEAEIHPGIE